MNKIQRKYNLYLSCDLVITALIALIAWKSNIIIINRLVTFVIWITILLLLFNTGIHKGIIKGFKPFLSNNEVLNLLAKEQMEPLEIVDGQEQLQEVEASKHFLWINGRLLPIYLIDGYWIKKEHIYLTLKNGIDIHIGKIKNQQLFKKLVSLLNKRYQLDLQAYPSLKNIIRDKTNTFFDQCKSKEDFKKIILK